MGPPIGTDAPLNGKRAVSGAVVVAVDALPAQTCRHGRVFEVQRTEVTTLDGGRSGALPKGRH
jgi:hypothetical protein